MCLSILAQIAVSTQICASLLAQIVVSTKKCLFGLKLNDLTTLLPYITQVLIFTPRYDNVITYKCLV